MNTVTHLCKRAVASALLLTLLAVVIPEGAAAQEAAQKSFPSARAAVAALVAANKANDVPALNEILGPGAASLISSGDETQDRNDRARFVSLYEAHHRVARVAEQLTLLVGKDEWPMPIPLVKSEGLWRFDSDIGAKELLYRRIGANELDAIRVARALQRAQLDYATTAHDGNEKGLYAARFRSTPGKQDGLYWPVAEGEAQSPAGPLIAEAEADGYDSSQRHPFYGYYFRVLKAQGPHARGGAKDYLVDGKMSGGFAILGFPVEYGASGVMSFLVSPRGTVFEKDLGESTTEEARAMKTFDPDPTWKVLK